MVPNRLPPCIAATSGLSAALARKATGGFPLLPAGGAHRGDWCVDLTQSLGGSYGTFAAHPTSLAGLVPALPACSRATDKFFPRTCVSSQNTLYYFAVIIGNGIVLIVIIRTTISDLALLRIPLLGQILKILLNYYLVSQPGCRPQKFLFPFHGRGKESRAAPPQPLSFSPG